MELIRIKHWVKNILIFLPLFFSGNLLNISKITYSILAFIAFSTLASIVYVINDIADLEKDKKHPIKKHRPLASNYISLKSAYIVIKFNLVVGLSKKDAKVNDRDYRYPYLSMAEYHKLKQGSFYVTDSLYPLSWEKDASEANYQKLSIIGQSYVTNKISPTHSWHASEMLLFLLDETGNLKTIKHG